MNLSITKYCIIKNGKVFVDGVEYFSSNEDKLNPFIKEFYRSEKPSYSKFFKMDDISKLGFIATETLLKDFNKEISPDKFSIVLSNSKSTLVTDQNFQNTVDKEDEIPSPAIFVYTLPNIMIGEISIRHNLKGENAFFINKSFDSNFISNYVHSLFCNHKTDCCIAGWVDYSNDKYEAFVYLVEKECCSKVANHNNEEINKLYKK